MRSKSFLAVAAIAATCLSSNATAHSPMDNVQGGDLAQLSNLSNLVFIGQAEQVTYRNARKSEGEGDIPYTLVTYRVDKVLRGKAPGEKITMRLVGGPDGRGRFLSVEGVPAIQQGDQDLLFVSNTGDASCPLVFCEHGRYRILKEQVYDTYGSPVRAILKSNVVSRGAAPKEFQTVRYPSPKFDDLIKNPEVARQLKAQQLSTEEARRRYEEGAPKFMELMIAAPEPEKLGDAGKGDGSTQIETLEAKAEIAAGPMPLAQFVEVTQRLIAQSTRQPTAVRSIDPDAAIIAAKVTRTTPKKSASPRQIRPTATDAEEYKAYEKNEFNPVIRK